MITIEKIRELIKDKNVNSVSMCKYIQNSNKSYMLDFDLCCGKKLHEPITESIYDEFNAPEEKGDGLCVKRLK